MPIFSLFAGENLKNIYFIFSFFLGNFVIFVCFIMLIVKIIEIIDMYKMAKETANKLKESGFAEELMNSLKGSKTIDDKPIVINMKDLQKSKEHKNDE